MEARCHVGQSIIYDTVGRKGWAVDLRAHRIGEVINRILNEDWEPPPEDEPIEIDPPKALLERILEAVWAEQFWGWPGRGLPAKRKEPEPVNEGKRKKKNPNAVPRAESEESCEDCFRWYVSGSLVCCLGWRLTIARNYSKGSMEMA
jgi:lipase ATG15